MARGYPYLLAVGSHIRADPHLTALLLAILLALAGGGNFPPSPIAFDEAGADFLTGLLLFAANLLGGYLGGKLGAPSGR
ncbi:MAG TPA: hypothetical protein VI027_13595 [Rubrobacteraceae bacterium]